MNMVLSHNDGFQIWTSPDLPGVQMRLILSPRTLSNESAQYAVDIKLSFPGLGVPGYALDDAAMDAAEPIIMHNAEDFLRSIHFVAPNPEENEVVI